MSQADMDRLLRGLDEYQRTVVLAPPKALAVFAGPGSGKTHTGTRRIGAQISAGANPNRILAITFTRYATKEMKSRLQRILPPFQLGANVCTFHAFGAYLLRQRELYHLVGLRTKDFTILDSDDAKRVMREVIESMDGGRDEDFTERVKQVITDLEDCYNKDLHPADLDKTRPRLTGYWREYERRLLAHNVVDYAGLLRHTRKLCQTPGVGEDLARLYDFVFVDEFQDTNLVQTRVIDHFAAKQNITIIGDDDQSVYGFRGADRENFARFKTAYRDHQVMTLPINYRCTGRAVRASRALIEHNTDRMHKELQTPNDDGIIPTIYQASDDRDEALWVAREITKLVASGIPPKQICILYRLNALGPAFESALISHKIPCKIIGDVSFFERREIKDVVAYLTLLQNPHNDIATSRVINVPKRGIGEKKVAEVSRLAAENGSCMLQAMEIAADGDTLPKKQRDALAEFINVIETGYEMLGRNELLGDIAQMIVDRTGYMEYLQGDEKHPVPPEDFLGRQMNVHKLISDLRVRDEEDKALSTVQRLSSFMEDALLEGRQDPKDNAVSIMTAFKAKGLEFDVVFVVGAEQGIFPFDGFADSDIEQERNIFYVATTRMRTHLYFTLAGRRMRKGEIVEPLPSQFFKEMLDVEPMNQLGVHRRGIHEYNYPQKTGRPQGNSDERERENSTDND